MATESATASATPSRLPLGTVVKDKTGRVGEVFDYGLDEHDVRIYYVRDDAGEWKQEAGEVTVLDGWQGTCGGTAGS